MHMINVHIKFSVLLFIFHFLPAECRVSSTTKVSLNSLSPNVKIPTITTKPEAKVFVPRQATTSRGYDTCGYTIELAAKPVICEDYFYCTWDQEKAIVGCCVDYSITNGEYAPYACHSATSCYDSSLYKQLGEEQLTATDVLLCTNSRNPFCNVILFTDVHYSMYTCGTSRSLQITAAYDSESLDDIRSSSSESVLESSISNLETSFTGHTSSGKASEATDAAVTSQVSGDKVSRSEDKATIIGGDSGGIVAAAVAAGALILLQRRQKKTSQRASGSEPSFKVLKTSARSVDTEKSANFGLNSGSNESEKPEEQARTVSPLREPLATPSYRPYNPSFSSQTMPCSGTASEIQRYSHQRSASHQRPIYYSSYASLDRARPVSELHGHPVPNSCPPTPALSEVPNCNESNISELESAALMGKQAGPIPEWR